MIASLCPDRVKLLACKASRLTFPCIVVLASLFVSVVGTGKYGPGVSPDGIAYLSAAESFLLRGEFRDYDGAYFLSWPPLFPFLIAGIMQLGLTALEAARWANVFAWSATVGVFGCVARVVSGNRPLGTHLVVTALLASAFPLVKNSVMAWSEPLFILLTMIAIGLTAHGHLLSSKRLFTVLCCAVGLASLQRYLGVALTISTLLSVLIVQPRLMKLRIASAAIVGVSGGLGLTAWLTRNYLVSGTLTGGRDASHTTLAGVGTRFFSVLIDLFVAPGLSGMLHTTVYLAAICFVAIACSGGMLVLAKRNGDGSVTAPRSLLFSAGLFALTYSCIVAVGVLTVGLEPLSIRYLSPLLIPLCLMAVTLASMDRKYLIGVLLTSGIILCGNLVSMWEVHSIWRDVGAGDFSVTDWQESETLKWIKQNPTRQPLYSNAADFASFFGRSTVNRFPKSGGVSEELFSGGDVLYGAFFARSFRRYLASPEELVSVCREYQRVEFEDGLLIVCHRS